VQIEGVSDSEVLGFARGTCSRLGLDAEGCWGLGFGREPCEIWSRPRGGLINSLVALVYPVSSATSACGLDVDNSLAHGYL
jgi:hypothetical protein